MIRCINTFATVFLLASGVSGTVLAAPEDVSPGTGAVLRGLDKIDAGTTDMQIADGQTSRFGSLEITLKQCRYPVGNPSGDAFAYLQIQDVGGDTPKDIFDGWMVASSPALNALDHFRYDVWVLRCTVPSGVQDPAQQPVEPPSEDAVPLGDDHPVD